MSPRELESLYRRILTAPTSATFGYGELAIWDRDASCAVTTSHPQRNPAVIVQIDGAIPSIGRVTTGISLTALPNASWRTGSECWEGPGALIECRHLDLLPTFSVVAADLFDRFRELRRLPKWRDVLLFVEDWEALFARSRTMDEQEQLGLWGELKLIQRSGMVDCAIKAWVASSSARADFMKGDVSLEVKTSRNRGKHYVSQDQAEPIGEPKRAFLVSIWAEIDEVAGLSVPELIAEILKIVEDPIGFEKKLLDRGYSRRDAPAYARRWQMLQFPRLFPFEKVPRIRAFDPGVSRIRYFVDLDDRSAVDESVARDTLEVTLTASDALI